MYKKSGITLIISLVGCCIMHFVYGWEFTIWFSILLGAYSIAEAIEGKK